MREQPKAVLNRLEQAVLREQVARLTATGEHLATQSGAEGIPGGRP